MRNRAKCRLCESIIESFHATDYVSCKCGHISVSEGQNLGCGAIDFSNFMRVDDEGNEIIVREVNQSARDTENLSDIKEMVDELHRLVDNLERLPQHTMSRPVNHYDLCSSLLLIGAILKKVVNQLP